MAYPTPAASVSELMAALAGIAHVADGRLVIDDEARLRDDGHPRRGVVGRRSATDTAVVEAARWLIWEASQLLGAPSASIHELYMARGRGEVHGFTVPGGQPAHAGLRHGRWRCAARRTRSTRAR